MKKIDYYQKALKAFEFQFWTSEVWISVGKPSTEYGWKLHVSSVQKDAPLLLKRILPLLSQFKCPFKIAKNSEILGWLNEGEFGATQVGKFATIYPSSNQQSLEIAKKLIDNTHDFKGPKIITDLHLGNVIYTRYGSFSPKTRWDRLGNLIQQDDQKLGQYRVPFFPPRGVSNPFKNYYKSYPKNNQGGVSPIGPGYLVNSVLTKHAKGSVYTALDLRERETIELVVLKEGRRHCMSDLQGRDIVDRLRHQKKLHEQLHGKVSIPKAGELFEHFDNLYLPLEYIDGRSFSDRPSKPFFVLSKAEKLRLIRDFEMLIEVLSDLHKLGYVHRDLSPRNIRVSNKNRLYLLDLEMCHLVDSRDQPFLQGTPGFISKEQELGKAPAFSNDIFAIGSLIINAITGLDPRRILYSGNRDLYKRLLSLSGATKSICNLAIKCVSDNAFVRPRLEMISKIFAEVYIEINTGDDDIRDIPNLRLTNLEKEEIIKKGLNWILSDAPKNGDSQMWLSPEIESSNHDASLRMIHSYKVYRSASRGVAGILYILGRLKQIGFDCDLAREQANHAVDWLLDHEPTPDDQMPGLHFGEAGVAVAIAQAISSGLIENGQWVRAYLSEALSGPVDWPDLTHGAAGQGIAALRCASLLDDVNLAALSTKFAKYLLESQKEDGSWEWPAGVDNMEGTVYTGFAHGVAGIVYFLTMYSTRLDDIRSLRAAELGANWLMEKSNISVDKASLSWPMTTNKMESWSWWCHGSPGIALAFLSLFDATRNDKYAETARKALRVHPKFICYPNLSQCHGLSGLGEIYLEAYRVLEEDEWLSRAKNIGDSLYALTKITSTNASWLVENPYIPTADFMIGCSGVLHFLARLTRPLASNFGLPLL